MDELRIYFSDDTELIEYEAIMKGYREDVYVYLKENVYKMSVYTLIRLQQDFDTELQMSGYYSVEPNLILVKETSKFEITRTINKLFSQGYFQRINGTNSIDLSQMIKIQ